MTKKPALVQLPKALTLVDAREKFSQFMLAGEQMDKQYTMVMCMVMLYYGGRYVSIQGQNDGDDTSLNFCPGVTPPAYLSYGICSKNAFRIYRRP